ncbi:hypothetical protein [Persicirhabdus sediminis]|uniref:Uncharacterized protein n=1 Tax=Persicirhabdus sediminis TaxID=454144 RepID=A0A8J7MF85_9BACT|nr:hypothetical protein [Persicirhabdus sediminis]MBK1791632.1 hypothetical protein [Persicirhabdus sediminis]
MTFTSSERGVLVALKRHGIECKEYFSAGSEYALSSFLRAVLSSATTKEVSWISECQDLSFHFTPATNCSKAVFKSSMCIDKEDEHGAFEVQFAYDIMPEEISVDFEAIDDAFKTTSA